MTYEDQIKEIEDEIAKTQYNKATEKHIGKLKAKLALLRAQSAKGGGKKGAGYSVKKTGDATVLLVGLPSVGKSTLLNKLTNAESKVGDYEFTTLDVVPGVMEYNGAKIQMLDIPGIVEGAATGKGRGKEILSVVRSADLILIMVDVNSLEIAALIENELYEAGFRLNQSPPDVKITRKDTGGITVMGNRGLGRDAITSVLKEFGIYNADVSIREKLTLDRFIDALMKNRVYVPALVLVNKADIGKAKSSKDGYMYISALKGTGVERLKELVWEKLGLIRIYMKKPGKEPDRSEPLILKKPCTISDVIRRLHKNMRIRFARVWGPSAKFPGQRVGPAHGLGDGDAVELHID